jgi:4,5-DOPA dioxygenase extradiol
MAASAAHPVPVARLADARDPARRRARGVGGHRARPAAPKAILIASAHWETDVPAVTGTAKPETIHDFYGFPKPLYEIQYPRPAARSGCKSVDLLKQSEFKAVADPIRGLDHGAWSPLLYMYPKATCRWCRSRCRRR